jgi:hypothetical protein
LNSDKLVEAMMHLHACFFEGSCIVTPFVNGVNEDAIAEKAEEKKAEEAKVSI